MQVAVRDSARLTQEVARATHEERCVCMQSSIDAARRLASECRQACEALRRDATASDSHAFILRQSWCERVEAREERGAANAARCAALRREIAAAKLAVQRKHEQLARFRSDAAIKNASAAPRSQQHQPEDERGAAGAGAGAPLRSADRDACTRVRSAVDAPAGVAAALARGDDVFLM